MGWLAEVGGVRSVMILITLSTFGVVIGGLLSPKGVPGQAPEPAGAAEPPQT
jgi:hypothetical protein